MKEETRRKISESLKKNPVRYWLGKKRDRELSEKVGNSLKIMWQNPEYHKKMSEAHKGCKQSEETIKKRFLWHKNYSHSEQTRNKISTSNKGKKGISGKNHYNWKGGINYRDIHSLFNIEYRTWRTEVFIRDNFKCKISDEHCQGMLQAHHILPWRDFVELRYKVNNGITLCHAHHPRKRAEEKRLSPYFMDLVSVSK